jgi:hypothetical protein
VLLGVSTENGVNTHIADGLPSMLARRASVSSTPLEELSPPDGGSLASSTGSAELSRTPSRIQAAGGGGGAAAAAAAAATGDTGRGAMIALQVLAGLSEERQKKQQTQGNTLTTPSPVNPSPSPQPADTAAAISRLDQELRAAVGLATTTATTTQQSPTSLSPTDAMNSSFAREMSSDALAIDSGVSTTNTSGGEMLAASDVIDVALANSDAVAAGSL